MTKMAVPPENLSALLSTMTDTEKRIYLTYGQQLDLDLQALAKVFGYANTETITVKICQGDFPIPTRKIGRKRYAALKDVAAYVDDEHHRAIEGLKEIQGMMFGAERAEEISRIYG